MPDAKKIQAVLLAADFKQYKIAKKVQQATAGFRIQTSELEKRAVHVFHLGKGERAALLKYGMALTAAGYLVTPSRGGLKVANMIRTPIDRGK
jgi:hypothetical protein